MSRFFSNSIFIVISGTLTVSGSIYAAVSEANPLATATKNIFLNIAAGTPSPASLITSDSTSTAVLGQQWSYWAQASATTMQWSIVAAPDSFPERFPKAR